MGLQIFAVRAGRARPWRAALMASAAVAMTVGRRRLHYGRPIRADRTGRDKYPITSAG